MRVRAVSYQPPLRGVPGPVNAAAELSAHEPALDQFGEREFFQDVARVASLAQR
jgi:hypothetical protein